MKDEGTLQLAQKVGSTPRIGISTHKGTEVCKHLPVKKRGDLYGSDTTYLEMEQRPAQGASAEFG